MHFEIVFVPRFWRWTPQIRINHRAKRRQIRNSQYRSSQWFTFVGVRIKHAKLLSYHRSDVYFNVSRFSCFSLECHNENEIRARDPIRCRECGYRIMYKKRTKRCKYWYTCFELKVIDGGQILIIFFDMFAVIVFDAR